MINERSCHIWRRKRTGIPRIVCAIRGGLLVPSGGNDDERHGDLRNRGRRYIADLLCAGRGCRTAVPIADHLATAPDRAAAITAAQTAGALPTGSVVTIPHWIVRAIRSTPAEAIAGEAAMEVAAATGVAEVINVARLRRVLICRNSDFLDSF